MNNKQEAMAALLRLRIIQDESERKKFENYALKIPDLITVKDSDDRITRIFKRYLANGQSTSTLTEFSITSEEFIKTIVFKTANNNEITLLAKIMYFQTGRCYDDFLDYQIRRLRSPFFKRYEHEGMAQLYISYLCKCNGLLPDTQFSDMNEEFRLRIIRQFQCDGIQDMLPQEFIEFEKEYEQSPNG